MPDGFADLLAMPFVWRALAAGVLISLCAAILGVTLVLRRMSFIGDGLSHVAFGAMAVAAALNLAGAQTAVALPVTAICAAALLRGGAKVQGDAALAMLSVGAMAAGYLVMNIFPASSNISGDVCSTLFGAVSILTLTNAETLLCAALSVGVIVFHALTYHVNFDIAFDEDFARSSGVRASLFNLVSAVVAAVVIVVSMRLVGALLVSALIVFPAVSAMRLAKSFRAVTLLSAGIAVATALAGILLAVAFGTPVGATIVAVDVMVLLVFRWPVSIVAVLLALAAAVFHMRGAAPAAPAPSKSVVAATFPLYDWTRNIVGERTNAVSVAMLGGGAGDLHSYRPSADDMRKIADAALFVHVGGVSDVWAEKLACRHPLALLPLLPPRRNLPAAECCAHGHGHGGREAEHCDAQDEHIWLSLRDAATCVSIIAAHLCQVDPDGTEIYMSNARRYASLCLQLDADFAARLAGAENRTVLFADRFPFARLADDHSLNCIAAFRGCSADAEASFATIAMLAHEIDVHSLNDIFVLEQGDCRLALAVRSSTATGSQSIRRLDSMQSAQRAPYLETMRANLFALANALCPARGGQ